MGRPPPLEPPVHLLALSLLLSTARADLAPMPPPLPVEEMPSSSSLSLVELLRAAGEALTEEERAARAATEEALGTEVKSGLAGASAGEQKAALFSLMSRLALHQGMTAALAGRDGFRDLKQALKLHEQVRMHYPDSPQLFGMACRAWAAAMLMEDLDGAQRAADAALASAAAAEPGQGALARLLRAEVHAARGEADAARALLAEAVGMPSAVPGLIRYRQAALGVEVSADVAPTGDAPDWLLGVEQKLRSGQIGG